MKRVLITLLVATVLILMAFVIGCSSKVTGADLFTDGIMSDDFKVHVLGTQWLIYSSPTGTDNVRIWDQEDLRHYLLHYENREDIWYYDLEGNLVKPDYLIVLEEYLSKSFFRNKYLIIVRSGKGGGFVSEEIMGLESDGTINITTRSTEWDCCHYSVDLGSFSYIIELPRAYRPGDFRVNRTVEIVCICNPVAP